VPITVKGALLSTSFYAPCDRHATQRPENASQTDPAQPSRRYVAKMPYRPAQEMVAIPSQMFALFIRSRIFTGSVTDSMSIHMLFDIESYKKVIGLAKKQGLNSRLAFRGTTSALIRYTQQIFTQRPD
jgi:hypothetical protein